MGRLIKLIAICSIVANANSEPIKKLSGRLLSLGAQCEMPCVDTLRIINSEKKTKVAVMILPPERASLNFGDSVDLLITEYDDIIVANQMQKYTGFDKWYIAKKAPFACWKTRLSDSIGKVAENRVCVSKNTNPRQGFSPGQTSYSGTKKGSRILGYSFFPKIIESTKHIIISIEWTIGYAGNPKTVQRQIKIENGKPEIQDFVDDGHSLEIEMDAETEQ